MIYALKRRLASITPPQAIVNTASWTTAEIDTTGYDYCVFNIYLGALDIAITALKVTESDTTGSGHVDITASIFGTANNDTGSASTLPSATDDNHFFSFFIDLRGRKRFLKLVATIGTGSTGGFMTAWAELSRAEDAPRTAAQAGYTQRIVM